MLWAFVVLGVAFGFLFSAALGRIAELVFLLLERRWRIEDARRRDHAAVPQWPTDAGTN